MQLYGIGDLHLSLGVPEKPMDIFHGWENYMQLLEQHWRAMVQPEDTVVLAGDLSWGMTLPQAKADFAFLETLPGQKIILKGNHDYWWNSMKKMQQFFADNGFDGLCSTAISQDNYFFIGQSDAVAEYHIFKTGEVRVITAEFTIVINDRIDSTDSFGIVVH